MAILIRGKNPYLNNFSSFYKNDRASKSVQGSNEDGSNDYTTYTSRRLEYEQRLEMQRKSVVEQTMNYAQQLSASRTKTKDASLEKKKLQYSFKKISSQIIRSKNSVSARKAVQAAKREIMRLKRLKSSGEYDDEELQLAIDHAKAMEKVAKKKVSHLEMEEMVERCGKGALVTVEEIEEKNKDNENPEDGELAEKEEDYEDDVLEEELMQSSEAGDIQWEVDPEFEAEVETEAMTDMMDEFEQEMAQLMEDLDLTELAESMYAPDPDMSENDLKLLKIKHRAKEMKEIAKADRDYLKGIFEHEEKKLAQTGPSIGTGTGTGAGTGSAFGAALAPATGEGFSVSI